MNNQSLFWEKEILEIEDQSKIKEDIDAIFYGSSSIKLWTTLKDDFSPFNVLNHGFGGSKLSDATYYYNRMIEPYHPRLVVVFSGSNDIDFDVKTKSYSKRAFKHFKALYKKHRKILNTPFIFIAINPTIYRFPLYDEVKKTNELIKNYAMKKQNLYMLDVTDKFLSQGEPIKELYQNDGVHLSSQGYQIWVEALKPILDDLL